MPSGSLLRSLLKLRAPPMPRARRDPAALPVTVEIKRDGSLTEADRAAEQAIRRVLRRRPDCGDPRREFGADGNW
jgi:fructose-1,6-bisphosphatase/inositol monophosphatase family enzyme